MMVAIIPSAADVLVELDLRGIKIAARGKHLILRPKGAAPEWLKGVIQQNRAEVQALLADPRRRWREQTEAVVAMRFDDDREDLLHLFDEREAIAALDGGLGDDEAGQEAYKAVKASMEEEKA